MDEASLETKGEGLSEASTEKNPEGTIRSALYKGSRKKILGIYLLTVWTDDMNTYKIYCFAETAEFEPATMILVDDALAKVYPRFWSHSIIDIHPVGGGARVV